MNILIVSPTIEDTQGRGINAIAKSLIDSAKTLDYSVGLLTGIPRHKNVESSSVLEAKIEHVILQNYLLWGRKNFDFIVRGGYSKINIAKAIVKGDVYKSKRVDINNEFLGNQPGNLLKRLDFCIESPYVYQFMVRNHENRTKKILTKLVAKHKIDIILCTSPVVIKNSWFSKRVKVIQFVHDAMPIELVETPPDNNTPYVFGLQFEAAALHSDLLLANSKDTAKKILEINPHAKVEVLYGALPDKKPDTSRSNILSLKGLEEGKYLLFNSVLEKRKNLETLFDAYSMVHDRLGMPLVLVGAPGYGFKDILKKLNSLPQEVREDILFTGWLSNTDRLKLFENANSFIFPSIYEGLGIGILEAMEYSLPTLTSRVGALAEIGEDAVFFIDDPYNAAEIAAGIEKIATDTALRKELIENGLSIIGKYSQSKFNERAKKALLATSGRKV